MLDRVLLVQHELVLPVTAQLVRLDADGVVGLITSDSLDRNIRQSVSRNVVQAKHTPGSSSGALLDVSENVELESVSRQDSIGARQLTLDRETCDPRLNKRPLMSFGYP